jgi:predicted acylesterase/phospholipase RssA
MNPDREGAGPAASGSSGDGTQKLRVALSGGGLRAAVFDLGLLLYLVDAGLNARVEQISSVSGGSITNAFVARRCNFQKVSSQEFDGIAARLLKIIVRHGLIRRPLIIGYLALVIAAASFTVSAWLTQFPVHLSGWACLLLAAGTVLLLTLRGRVLDLQLERTLSQASGLAWPRRLRDVTSPIEHIFCATDLRTGMPFYFSTAHDGYAYSPVLGFSLRVQLPLARVVRASAAFPGGIPPLRYKSRRHFALTRSEISTQLRMTGNYSLGHYAPRIFMLADGGIWNNLATEPFLEDRLWFGPDITHDHVSKRSQPPGLLIVANASSPLLASGIRDYQAPLLGEAFSFKRSLKIATANTVVPRIKAIRARTDTAVVSIIDSYDRALSELHDPQLIARLPPDCDALKLWRAHTDFSVGDFLVTFEDTKPWRVHDVGGHTGKADNNADIRTSLTRIPRWRVIMLLTQAYENAQSELAVMLGLPVPKTSAGVSRFDRLISETPRDRKRELRGDRTSRARRRRRYRTMRPQTIPDGLAAPPSIKDQFRYTLWQFWDWLTKEEPRLQPTLRTARLCADPEVPHWAGPGRPRCRPRRLPR